MTDPHVSASRPCARQRRPRMRPRTVPVSKSARPMKAILVWSASFAGRQLPMERRALAGAAAPSESARVRSNASARAMVVSPRRRIRRTSRRRSA